MYRRIAMFRLFVYGTLKRGEPNYDVMEEFGDKVRFVMKATTKEKFPLVVATDFNTPFLLHIPGHGHNVKGELYDVTDQETIDKLDEFELCGQVYERTTISVVTEKGEESVWAYVLMNPGEKTRSLPCLEDYNDEQLSKQGQAYCKRCDRESTFGLLDLAYQLKQ